MTTTWTFTYWSTDVPQTFHVKESAARWLWQYREKPRLNGALEAFLEEIDGLEQVALDVMVGRWPLTAIGVQLDTLGKIVGQERGTDTDDEYRLRILARILVNKGNGRVEDLYSILVRLGLTDMVARELYPANLVLESCGQTSPAVVGDLLSDAKPGGVRLDFVYSTYTRAQTFQASGLYATEEYDAARGAGAAPYDTTTGGRVAGSETT